MNNSNTADGQRLAFALKYSFASETHFINGVLYLYQTCPRAKADMRGIADNLVARGYTLKPAHEHTNLNINLTTTEGYDLYLYIESIVIR